MCHYCQLSKNYTNKKAISPKVLVFSRPGNGLVSKMLNHNQGKENDICCYVELQHLMNDLQKAYQDPQNFDFSKFMLDDLNLMPDEYLAQGLRGLLDRYGAIVFFGWDLHPFWSKFLFQNMILAEKPLQYYLPDEHMPADSCVIYIHKKDGWHCYVDKCLSPRL